MNKFFPLVVACLVIGSVSCTKTESSSGAVKAIAEPAASPVSQGPVFKELSGPPSAAWVGKKVEIEFGPRWGKSLANVVTRVKLVSVATDTDGFKYFKIDYPLPNGGYELYFDWFDSAKAPHLQSWQELVSY